MRLKTDRENQRAHVVSARYGTGAALTSGTAAPDNTIGKEGDLYHKVDGDGVLIEEHQMQSGAYVKLGDINPSQNSLSSTVVSEIGTFTTATATTTYRLFGNKMAWVLIGVNITFKGTADGYVKVTIPGNRFQPSGSPVPTGSGTTTLSVSLFSLATWDGTSTNVYIRKYDGTTAIAEPTFLSTTLVFAYQ